MRWSGLAVPRLLKKMNKNRRFRFIPVVLACGGLLFSGACTTNHYLSRESRSSGTLSDETVQKHSTGGSLQFVNARLITANDEAFLSKLDMVRSAERSIDAAYYIFSDDVTSSALAAELIAAAQRGVRVRLLLDYSSAYKDLDLFSMMQNEGNRGSGNLEVRFYNRPTRNIVSEYVRSIRDSDKAAKFDYYELQSSAGDIHRSPHSKVWVLGDDIIVGSANADVRSYMMDANNAVLIRRAPKLRRQYEAMFDSGGSGAFEKPLGILCIDITRTRNRRGQGDASKIS